MASLNIYEMRDYLIEHGISASKLNSLHLEDLAEECRKVKKGEVNYYNNDESKNKKKNKKKYSFILREVGVNVF